MRVITVRLPDELHAKLRQQACNLGIDASLNRLAIGALMTVADDRDAARAAIERVEVAKCEACGRANQQ